MAYRTAGRGDGLHPWDRNNSPGLLVVAGTGGRGRDKGPGIVAIDRPQSQPEMAAETRPWLTFGVTGQG
jgi:hypothetical protein